MTREIQTPLELQEEMESLSIRIYRELKAILECTKLDQEHIEAGIRIRTPMGASYVISYHSSGISIMKCVMNLKLQIVNES